MENQTIQPPKNEPENVKPVEAKTPELLPSNPSLEQKLKSEGNPATTAQEPQKKRGRPKGSTNKPSGEPELEPKIILPTEANPLYVAFIMTLGKLWAKRTSPDMAFSIEEAESIALPLTQIVAYHLPDMPPIVVAYIHMSMAVVGVIIPRVEIMKAWKAEQERKKLEEKKP